MKKFQEIVIRRRKAYLDDELAKEVEEIFGWNDDPSNIYVELEEADITSKSFGDYGIHFQKIHSINGIKVVADYYWQIN